MIFFRVPVSPSVYFYHWITSKNCFVTREWAEKNTILVKGKKKQFSVSLITICYVKRKCEVAMMWFNSLIASAKEITVISIIFTTWSFTIWSPSCDFFGVVSVTQNLKVKVVWRRETTWARSSKKMAQLSLNWTVILFCSIKILRYNQHMTKSAENQQSQCENLKFVNLIISSTTSILLSQQPQADDLRNTLL